MASDEDYMAFLDKANQDPSAGYAKTQTAAGGAGVKPFRTTEQGVEIPEPLLRVTRHAETFYISDADEPFEPVALRWDEKGSGLPDEGLFFFAVVLCYIRKEEKLTGVRCHGQRNSLR